MLRVTLDKLEFNSIREFEDVELSFKKGINFIQIRNGYGKSTTLQILRWMFTGTTPETSDDYPLYLRDESVSNHQETNKGHVVLHMTIDPVERLIHGGYGYILTKMKVDHGLRLKAQL